MAKPKKSRYDTRALTNKLRELAAEVHDMDPDGTMVTRGEALASLLWNKALGYKEQFIDDDGDKAEIIHPPEAWALQLVYDRLEGKTPVAIQEDSGKIKAKDKVGDLAKKQLNALAAAGPDLKSKGPPKRS